MEFPLIFAAGFRGEETDRQDGEPEVSRWTKRICLLGSAAERITYSCQARGGVLSLILEQRIYKRRQTGAG